MTTTSSRSIGRDRRTRRAALTLRLFALLLVAGLLQPLAGSPAAAAQTSTALPENVLQASVRIMINVQVTPDDRDEDPFLCMLDDDVVLDIGVGSGTIISEDGHILTNHHVIDPGRMPREVSNYCEDQAPRRRGTADWTFTAWTPDEKGNSETPYRVEVIQDSSFAEDLAVLEITEHLDGSRVNTRRNPFPYVEFGDSDTLREPEKVILVGYPANAGSSRRVSEGIFSGWGDNGYGVDWIYTDATISGGNSGGTAVNSQGLFIGIPTQATQSDCRPGDTNNDGLVDENDSGCVGIGGNYGILIPSNIARVFAEEALGEEIPVATPDTPLDDEPTPTPDETPEPADTDGPPFGDISFTAYDEEQDELDEFQNVNRLDGCFENFTAEEGQAVTTTWYLDDVVVLETDYEWDDAWNPEACASILIEEGEENPYLDAGTYRLELTTEGQTVVSDDVTIALAINVGSVTFSGRDADREDVEATSGNVLEGEIVTIYAEIAFTGMAEGSIWEVELYLDGELVVTSEPEAWDADPDDSETVRLRNPDRGPFAAGEYEVVISVDGEVSHEATVTIED